MELLSPEAISHQLYLNFQKIFRCLNFGRILIGKAPSVTGPQMRILSFFNEADVVHISAISRCFGMSLQSINNLVHRLESMGYVKKSKNRLDKRLTDIKLTQKGRELFNANRLEQIETLEFMLHQLEPSEEKALNVAIEMAAVILEKASQKSSSSIGNSTIK